MNEKRSSENGARRWRYRGGKRVYQLEILHVIMLRADLLTPRTQPALNELKIIRRIFEEMFHLYEATPPSKKNLPLPSGTDCVSQSAKSKRKFRRTESSNEFIKQRPSATENISNCDFEVTFVN